MNKTVTYGLIIGVVAIAVSLIQYQVAGLTGGILWSLIGFVVGIALHVIFANKLKAANGGVAGFGKMFGWLFTMSAIAVVLSGIFTIVYISSVGGDVVDSAMDQAMEQSMGGMSDAEVEAAETAREALSTAGSGLMIGAMILGLIGALVIYAIIDLILAAILKKEPPVAK
ncbi:MAG: DUF4199 domain-containing protein [Flavobacteriales bacterium]